MNKTQAIGQPHRSLWASNAELKERDGEAALQLLDQKVQALLAQKTEPQTSPKTKQSFEVLSPNPAYFSFHACR